jgi:hypothetical protein
MHTPQYLRLLVGVGVGVGGGSISLAPFNDLGVCGSRCTPSRSQSQNLRASDDWDMHANSETDALIIVRVVFTGTMQRRVLTCTPMQLTHVVWLP